jgi:RND superfamily putative drug exporter
VAAVREAPGSGQWTPGRIAGGYARWLIRLRWLVVAFWLAVVCAALWYLPAMSGTGGDLNQLASLNNPAVQAEIDSTRAFGYPLLTRVAVVQHDPKGLSLPIQARALQRAAAVDRHEYDDIAPIVAAVAVPNTGHLFPGSHESSTTVVTYLYTSPDVTLAEQVAAARRFVARHFDASDHVVGVTGSIPARLEQGRLIMASVPIVEAATLAAVVLIVAIAYRSVVAPVLTVTVAVVATVLTLHVAESVGRLFGVAAPAETEPLLVALLLGVATDYVVFYLSGMRMQLAAGAAPRAAAEWATARFTPITATAGAIVAVGTGALIVARSPVFRGFGPVMAVAVLIAAAVSVTLMPALLAILGPLALWPSRRRPDRRERSGKATIWSRLLTMRLTALVVLAACVAGLVFAALPLRHLALGLPFSASLPASNDIRQAGGYAESGFVKGILSPTELVVRATGLTGRRPALDKLQQSLAGQPGVAGVLGPGNQIPQMEGNALLEDNPSLTPDGTAARYLLILSDDPLDARGIATLSRLQDRLPGLLRAAGLSDARPSFAGDTAIAKYIVDQTTRDLGRIAVVALLVNLLILVLFLRAVVAPLCLLASSVLAIGATLGLTTHLFQDVLGDDGLTFYVPFVTAVLLVALGSDYNVFAVGHAWEEARHRPLRKALAGTLPQSARTIRTAGITLAASFGLLAIVPLRPFREIAFAMSVGILIDTLVVRSLVVPSMLSLLGSASEWPGSRLARRRQRDPSPTLGLAPDRKARPAGTVRSGA